MKPTNLLLSEKSGTHVSKFIRTGNDPYEFNLKVHAVGYTVEDGNNRGVNSKPLPESKSVLNGVKNEKLNFATKEEESAYSEVTTSKIPVAVMVI